jgi:PKD repeat protein
VKTRLAGRQPVGRQGLLVSATLLLLLAVGGSGASALPTGFQQTTVFSGLTNPSAIEFAADGRVFVAEKGGRIKVFSNLNDSTADLFADLGTNVHNFWDRGMLGFALDPNFTTGSPYIYVLYTYDAPIGGSPPTWGDTCPTPPGPTGDGCVVSARLSRLTANGNQMTGPEQVLINDWCQQYPSHSIGSLAFGGDGALYVSGGDGASFNFADWGQDGNPLNPCGDPPGGVGGNQTPPTAEGGALRSQDLRTPSDPTSLDGAILRVNPDTGQGMPNNPLAGSSDPNARRIIAHGLRNPFRMTIRPGTNEVWLGDVGWNDWEEINRIADPLGSVENFGWPCYEGNGHQSGYDSANLTICENLYALPGGVVPPYFAYNHSAQVVAGESCPTGSSSTAGIAFYPGGPFPDAYDGALFFADYSRDCIWVMFPGGNGLPNPSSRATFQAPAANPVDLQVGPDGALYYADFDGGTIRRIAYSANQPPIASATGAPTSGPAPLTVNFDGRGSSDPEGGPLTFDWDLDGDGTFDDSTAVRPARTYTQPGIYNARLRVTDNQNQSAMSAPVTISANNTPPTATINAPAPGTRWKVDDLISFLGSATDPQQGTLPGSALSWELVLQHCPSNCHQHQLQTWPGVASGSFAAPDHEYPSYLELRLTATDAGGLTDTKTLRLDPKTVVLSFESSPAGLQLTVGGSSGTTPFTRTVIEGSNNSVSAPSPQTFGGTDYEWVSWSDGGAQSHNVVASGSSTYTAAYAGNQPPLASASGAPTNGPTPLTVNFYGSGSSDPEGGPLTYAWELDGDGAFDDSTVVSPTHTYTQPGTYQARLRVTDEQNQSATSVPITISANTTPTGKPPVQLMCPKGQYLAQYFANQTLSGTPAFTRCEPAIANDWGRGGPGNGLGDNGFSVRWTGRFDFAAGVYAFTTRADDGVRLWVDGRQLVDVWVDRGATTYRASKTLARGEHEVKLEYYENGANAVVALRWRGCAPRRWVAEYFNNRTLSGTPTFGRCDRVVSFNWGAGGPGNGVSANNFSARWVGRFAFRARSYRFTARTSDGIRVWVDGSRLINQWRNQTIRTFTATRAMTAAEHEVRVEWYERTAEAVARVSWGQHAGLRGHSSP